MRFAGLKGQTMGSALIRLLSMRPGLRSLLLPGSAALLLLFAACSKPPTIESLIAEAKAYQKKGDAKAAIIQFKNVLQRDPKNADARYLLGTIYLEHGDAKTAEKEFSAALAAKHDPREVLPLLARALFEQAAFDKVLEQTRSSDYGEAALQPEVLGFRGHAQLSLGQPEDAARYFDEALKRKPEFPPALLGQVRLASQKGNIQAALDFVERALIADPLSLDAWLMKGDLDRAADKPAAALAAYEKALTLDTDGLAANLNLASMHMAAGKLDLARKHIETIRKVAPENPLGYYLLGLLEFRSKNFTAANEAVQKVLKVSPGYLPANALAGAVAYSVGANDQAESRLREAMAKYPNSLYLRKLFAAALLKARKVRAAIDVLGPALKVAPTDTVLLGLIAEAYFQNNDIPNARKYYELAAKQSPQNARLRTGLGLARLAAGDTDRALADLEAAVEFGGSAAEAFLVTSLLSLKQYDKALSAVTQMEKKRPEDPLTFNLKGAVLVAKGDVKGAHQAFERAAELQPAQFAAALNLAQLEVRENNPGTARKRFEQMLERDKGNVQVMLALSDLAVATGNRDEAMLWAERAKQVQPKAFAPSMAMAKLLFAKGDYANAIPVVQAALQAEPENADALNILAYSQLRLGRNNEALSAYSSLTSRYPDSAEALYGFSTVQLAASNLAGAELALNRALARRPAFPEAIYALAGVQLRQGKIAEAGKLASDTQKRLPKSAVGFAIEGDAASAAKHYDQAVRAYEKAFTLEKTAAVLIKLHTALRGAGKGPAADALAEEWLRKKPDDLQVRYFVADAAIKNDNLRAAAEQYQYALQKEPNKPPLLHNLIWVYERLGDPRALEAAESAYKIAPDNPGVLDDLGRLLAEKGEDTDRAIKLLDKARTLVPESQVVRYHLAKAYVKNGEKDRARNELEQLLRGRVEFAERTEAADLLKQLKN